MKRLKKFIGFFDIKILSIRMVLSVIDDHQTFIDMINKKENRIYSNFIYKKISSFMIGDGSGVIYKSDDNRPVIFYINSGCYKKDYLEDHLTHETNHLVDRLSKYCNFENEVEFRAYLQEDLKRDIKKIIYIKNRGGDNGMDNLSSVRKVARSRKLRKK